MTRSTSNIPQFPAIDSKIANREFTLTCIRQLQEAEFSIFHTVNDMKEDGKWKARGTRRSFSRQPFDFRPLYIQYPLLEYAAMKWTYHAKRYDYEDTNFYETLEEFCQPDNQTFRAWAVLYR